jgi:hypothetical protein
LARGRVFPLEKSWMTVSWVEGAVLLSTRLIEGVFRIQVSGLILYDQAVICSLEITRPPEHSLKAHSKDYSVAKRR